MLRSLKQLYGYEILALDGEIGKVDDFFFDDKEWTIRYLVVDTGPWIFGRKVLISPVALGRPDWIGEKFPVNLTRDQVKDSPEIDTDPPISKQQQQAMLDYYRWPVYWGTVSPPAALFPPVSIVAEADAEQETDAHLRRAKEVLDYHVEGREEGLGSVDDIILDDEHWIVRYLVLLTEVPEVENKKVLIAPFWIQSINFQDQQVNLDLTWQTIKDSPAFDPHTPIHREYEEVLYDYYGRPYYWIKR